MLTRFVIIAYNKYNKNEYGFLSIIAFVANARPVPDADRARILVFAEQGNRVRIPDTGQADMA